MVIFNNTNRNVSNQWTLNICKKEREINEMKWKTCVQYLNTLQINVSSQLSTKSMTQIKTQKININLKHTIEIFVVVVVEMSLTIYIRYYMFVIIYHG